MPPAQPPREADLRDAEWLPRTQSPASSYTSLRRYRTQAEAAYRAQTGPQVALRTAEAPGRSEPLFARADVVTRERPVVWNAEPAAHAFPPTPRPAFLSEDASADDLFNVPSGMELEKDESRVVTAERPRLPYPGAPLFGPRGIMTEPRTAEALSLPARTLTDVLGDAPETAQTAWPTRLFPLAGIATERPTGSLPPPAARPHVPGYGKLEASGDTGKTLLPRRITSLATVVIGILAVVVLLARPFMAGAHLGGNPNNYAAFAGANKLPTFTPDAKYTPVAPDTDHPAPVIWAESGFVLDETNGNVLFAKNPNEQLPMASTTKLMTAVVAIAHGNPDQWITITPDAANTGGTRMVLKVGERYTLRELLYAMLLLSANDAAEAVADGLGGNVDTFVRWMNETANGLGLQHTHFTNPHGLDDPNHYSSAHDLAVLGRYALSLPVIHQISASRTFTITATDQHPQHDFINMNQPMWWYPGADGGKPGWTGASQFVTVLSSIRNNHHLIAVIMHGKNDWVTDIRDLLNWGFDDFTWISPKDILQQHPIAFADSYGNFVWDTPERTLTVGDTRYYPYTGFALQGAFQSYFDAQGGVATLGFPRGRPVAAANGQLTQKFDKASITCVVATGTCQTTP